MQNVQCQFSGLPNLTPLLKKEYCYVLIFNFFFYISNAFKLHCGGEKKSNLANFICQDSLSWGKYR